MGVEYEQSQKGVGGGGNIDKGIKAGIDGRHTNQNRAKRDWKKATKKPVLHAKKWRRSRLGEGGRQKSHRVLEVPRGSGGFQSSRHNLSVPG